MKKLDITEDEVINSKIEKLGELFPNAIAKVKDEKDNIRKVVDFEKLREELGDTVVKSNSKRYLTAAVSSLSRHTVQGSL